MRRRRRQIYAEKAGNFERVMNADRFGDGSQKKAEYNDESALDSNNGYRSHVTATGLKKNASLGGQPLWDSSPLRVVPHSLRGSKPVTDEPWARDEALSKAKEEMAVGGAPAAAAGERGGDGSEYTSIT